jgi:hypothetical protein
MYISSLRVWQKATKTMQRQLPKNGQCFIIPLKE